MAYFRLELVWELHLALLFELYHEIFLGWLDIVGILFCKNLRNRRKSSCQQRSEYLSQIFTKTNLEEHVQALGHAMFWKVLWYW